MIEIGKFNVLKALRLTPPGMFLWDGHGEDVVLLPNKYIPQNLEIGEEMKVFIYRDSEDRIIATTLEPKIKLYEIASLQVKEVNDFGAFLDWGLEKDLMVPYREQLRKMKVGEQYLVYLYIDEDTNRLAATSKIDRFLEKDNIDIQIGDQVDLLVGDSSDLGVNVIINGTYKGLIYHSEIFRKISPGDKTIGFVKDIREDQKIDISLQQQGFRNIEPSAEFILQKLKASKGFLKLNDSSDPEDIMHTLQMSKKTFKKAIGTLFKQRLISIEEDGIHLLEKN
jgi:predicted RNA-binding protein (virulence factor B family)